MKSNYIAMKELFEEKHGLAEKVTKEESSTRPSTMSCLVHNATLDIYCHNCNSSICMHERSITKNHKFHSTEEAASDMKKILLNSSNSSVRL